MNTYKDTIDEEPSCRSSKTREKEPWRMEISEQNKTLKVA